MITILLQALLIGALIAYLVYRVGRDNSSRGQFLTRYNGREYLETPTFYVKSRFGNSNSGRFQRPNELNVYHVPNELED